MWWYSIYFYTHSYRLLVTLIRILYQCLNTKRFDDFVLEIIYIYYYIQHEIFLSSPTKLISQKDSARIDSHLRIWGRFENIYELVNLGALKSSLINKLHTFQSMGKIFCVEFQRVPLKFHSKYFAHTLKETNFVRCWKFKISQKYELVRVFETPLDHQQLITPIKITDITNHCHKKDKLFHTDQTISPPYCGDTTSSWWPTRRNYSHFRKIRWRHEAFACYWPFARGNHQWFYSQ